MSELDYPLEFYRRSRKSKVAGGLCCVWCGAVQGETKPSQDGVERPIVITSAHIKGFSKQHTRPRLVNLCRSCHRHYDTHGCLPPRE